MTQPFSALTPPYKTIAADPPWPYNRKGPRRPQQGYDGIPWPYAQMSVDDIKALPVSDLGDTDARLFLWTTNKYLRSGFDVVEAWGFKPGKTLTWCKKPQGTMNVTTEFIILGSRGSPPVLPWCNTTWFDWMRKPHSVKPPAAMDLIESWSPGPYLELFARQPRLGWDSWGDGYE